MKRFITAIAFVVASSNAFASTQYVAPTISGLNPSTDLTITNALDSSCSTKMATAIDLRGGLVDFAVNKNTIDTKPLWPLLCSPTVEATKVDVERAGQDITLTYTNRDKSMPKLIIVMQRVESENDDDAPTYQIVRVGDMNAMGYEEQAALQDWLLDCYAATNQDSLALN